MQTEYIFIFFISPQHIVKFLAIWSTLIASNPCLGAPPEPVANYPVLPSFPAVPNSDPSLRTIGRGGLGSILEVSGSQDDKNRVLHDFTKQKDAETFSKRGQSILYRSLIPDGTDLNGQFTNYELVVEVESPVLQLLKPRNVADKRRQKAEKRVADAEKRIA